MTLLSVDPKFRRIDWINLCRLTKLVGSYAFAVALGGWVVSIRANEASLPYKNRSTAQLEVIHQEVGANPVAQIRCDRRVAAAVAKAPVVLNEPQAKIIAVPSTIEVCPPPKPVTSDSVR
jgi:hypothetical protein